VKDRNFWRVTLALTAAMAAALLVMPLMQMAARPSIQYCEGWNAYFQRDALLGKGQYTAPPGASTNFYPPVSFHVIAGLARLTGDVNQTGRWVALISLFIVAGLCGAVVFHFTRRRPVAVFATLSVVIWIGLYKPDRIAMNDPQLLGSAFNLLGFYFYIRRPNEAKWLILSAAAFVISGFTKHSLIAFPIAVGLHLAMSRNWRTFAVWVSGMVGFAAVLLLLTYLIDGRYFLNHLLRPRTANNNLADPRAYFAVFIVPVWLAVAWVYRNGARALFHIMTITLVVTHLVAIALSTGDGVDLNIYFDCIYTLIIIGAMLFAEFEPVLANLPRQQLRVPAMALLLVAPSLGLFSNIESAIENHLWHLRTLKIRTEDFDNSVRMLTSEPGDAVCEDLLVCFKAGKPMIWDTFTVKNMIVRDDQDKDRSMADFVAKPGFSFVQVLNELTPGEGVHFTARSVDALMEHYSVAERMNYSLVMMPKAAVTTPVPIRPTRSALPVRKWW
jgi:hypothetical protein